MTRISKLFLNQLDRVIKADEEMWKERNLLWKEIEKRFLK